MNQAASEDGVELQARSPGVATAVKHSLVRGFASIRLLTVSFAASFWRPESGIGFQTNAMSNGCHYAFSLVIAVDSFSSCPSSLARRHRLSDRGTLVAVEVTEGVHLAF